jgi:AAA+ ATPase superfamily predicted ATPase
VERVVPVTETQPQKSRRGIYRLKDHYLRFWFRYVLPNHSQLELGGGSIILENLVMPEIDHFTSLAFEEICRQFLWQRGLSGKLPFLPTQVGNWWKANEEIDLVVLGESDSILVECKWSSKPVGLDILAELERKVEWIRPELENRRLRFALCSRSGFTPQLVENLKRRHELPVLLFDLPDMIGDDSYIGG